jgi:hypothetical protein
MILQVALSTVLLADAGLFIRSLQQLQSVDLGFVREGILTLEVVPEKFRNRWTASIASLLRCGRRAMPWRSLHRCGGNFEG